MRQFARLLSVQLNLRLGISALRAGWRDDRTRTVRGALIALIAIVSIGFAIGFYVWLLSRLFGPFRQLGMEGVLLGIAMLVAMLMVFLFGLFYLMGVLFFARDAEFLASLPIPHRTVYAAKFAQALLGEIATGALLLLPVLTVYGVQGGVDALYWVRMPLVVLLTPCIPLALSGILSLLLMRFTALWKRRELMTIIGSIALMLIMMVGQMRLSMLMEGAMDANVMLSFLSDRSALLRQIGAVFPPSGWAAEALLGDGARLALFAAVSALSLLLVIVLSGWIYHAGATAQLEQLARTRRVRMGAFRQRSRLFALFLREWKLALRSPTYALNGLMVIVIGPLMLLMVHFGGGSMAAMEPELSGLLLSIAGTEWLPLAVAGIFRLVMSLNMAATTSLSREGSRYGWLRVFPMRPGFHALAKYLFGYSVSALSVLAMGGAAMLVLDVGAPVIVPGMAVALIAEIAPLALSMVPDFVRPKLSWNSETEAIKQNINGVLGMLIGLLYTAALGFGCYLLLKGGMGVRAVTWALCGASLPLGWCAVRGLLRVAARSLNSIEG